GAFAISRSSTPGSPTAALGTPHFVEVTASSGVAHTSDGEYPFGVGAGVAVLDCDGDGRPDLYLAGGAGPAGVYRNVTNVGESPRFSVVNSRGADLTCANGAYPLDVDGDGIVDLAVLRIGGNVLLRGLGGCRFEHANERWGFDGGNRIPMAFSAPWEGSGRLRTLPP